jgi:hypothetical protein
MARKLLRLAYAAASNEFDLSEIAQCDNTATVPICTWNLMDLIEKTRRIR